MTASTDTSPVRCLTEGGVTHLVFNRPGALNALDVPTVKAFRAICEQLAGDASVRAIVVRGEGRAFGVGGDLAAMKGNATAVATELIENLHAGMLVLGEINAPVIAQLHGAVAGGSLSLAMGCDLAVAAEGSTFNLAYGRIGASCDGSSSWHLPRLVGLRKALEIALLSDNFDAQEALRLGLVNRVVPADSLAAETQALAERLAAGPTLAYGRMKRLLRTSFNRDLASQLDAERDEFQGSTRTADFAEGLDAFFSKRRATFQGR